MLSLLTGENGDLVNMTATNRSQRMFDLPEKIDKDGKFKTEESRNYMLMLKYARWYADKDKVETSTAEDSEKIASLTKTRS
jgi:hypothetical protein